MNIKNKKGSAGALSHALQK